jgi:hypothetical protein
MIHAVTTVRMKLNVKRPLGLHLGVVRDGEFQPDDRRAPEDGYHRCHDERSVPRMRFQQTTVMDAYAAKKNTRGATRSPKRYSSGIRRKITPLVRLTIGIHQTSTPTISP